jgi:imidazolonepropionase-like amidohydrolase
MNLRWLVRVALLAIGLVGCCLLAEGQNTVVIHAGRLFDGRSDQLLSNQVIVIQGDRIAEVGPVGSVKTPAGAEDIDLGRATVLPGLIDGHTHVLMGRKPGAVGAGWGEEILLKESWQYRTITAMVNVKKDLEVGFTAMRDCGSLGTMYSDTDLRRAINEGVIPGPRMQVATTPIAGTGWLPEGGFSPEVTVPAALRFANSPGKDGRQCGRTSSMAPI